ncbi:MAG TPA: hypothetical protein VGK59_23190 [Ohtaekwangia sp.]
MKNSIKNIVITALAMIALACSDTEVTPDPTQGLVKISDGYALGAEAKVEVWAKEELFAGYNELYIVLYDSANGDQITESHVHLYPEMTMMSGMSHSCPVEDPINEEANNSLFPAGVMFSMPSGDMGYWKLNVRVHNHHNGKTGSADLDVSVANPVTPRMRSFVSGEEKFYVGYRFTGEVKVGVNPFDVIAFRKQGDYYTPAEDLAFRIAPEMPSMDHGSPNNVDPVHTDRGHYLGKVNFTMTGLWRVHLDVLQDNELIQEMSFDTTIE